MGTRERREREKKRRRDQILSSARRIFWKKGYDGATMPEIARAAELAPGTLYLYFPSKESLYAELLVEGYDLLIDALKNTLEKSHSPRKKAEALIDGFFEFAAGHPEYFDIIFFVIQREGRGIEEIFQTGQFAHLAERQATCKRIAADVLIEAEPGCSEEAVSLRVDAVWSMLGGVVLYFLKEGPATFRSVTSAAKQLLMNAIFGKE